MNRDDFGWEADAACATVDPDLFHPEDGSKWQAIRAKAVCATCPVVAECLADSPAWDLSSVRGGMTWRERRRLRLDAA